MVITFRNIIIGFLLIWQPLGHYFITWIRIWIFSWNLRMQLSAINFCKVVCKCCGCHRPETNQILDQTDYGDNNCKKAYAMIANSDRLLDIIGFFSNALFL